MKFFGSLISGLVVTLACAFANADTAAPSEQVAGDERGAAIPPDASEREEAPGAQAPKNAISIAPLALLGGFVSAEYERGLGKQWSVFIAPTVKAYPGAVESVDLSGYGVNAGARYFLTGNAPEGLWIGPQAGYAHAEAEKGEISAKADGFAVAGLIGYTGLIKNVFYLSAGIGAGYTNVGASATNGRDSVEVGNDGLIPVGRANAGFAF